MVGVFEMIIRLIILLGILIFIHELGHFILAKLVGIRVERFSLGFPPRLFGKKIGETDYCISLTPLGGYVKMSGMIDESMDKDSIKGEPWEFMSKPIYQRFMVIVAGPAMNIVLAILIFAGITYFSGIREGMGVVAGKMSSANVMAVTRLQPGDNITHINDQPVKTWNEVEKLLNKQEEVAVKFDRDGQTYSSKFSSAYFDSMGHTWVPVVGELQRDFPGIRAGLQVGDRITAIDGNQIKTWEDLTAIIHASPGDSLTIEWTRNDQLMSAVIVPRGEKLQGKNMGFIGISYPVVTKEINLVKSIIHGANYAWWITEQIGYSIKMIFTGVLPFKEAFAGPVMIAKIAKDSADQGESSFIAFMALLSLNLGLLNLLPIPVLDGGHIVFLIIEAVIRRPISPKVKLVIQQVGMAIIIALMLFVIINDIKRW